MPTQKRFFADREEAVSWLKKAGFRQDTKKDFAKDFVNGAQHRARIQSVDRKGLTHLFINFHW